MESRLNRPSVRLQAPDFSRGYLTPPYIGIDELTKRIAFVHFYTFQMLRGIETLVVSLANELICTDYEVSILTAKRTLDPQVVPDPRVKVHEYALPRYFQHQFIVPFYAQNLIRQRYDYVVFFFADFGESWAWRLARPFMPKTKMLLYLCYPYTGVAHRYTSMERAGFFRAAHMVLADAQFVADDAQPIVKVPIGVVPVGTDPARFMYNPEHRADIRKQYGYTDDQIVLLNVSALEVRKGPRRVIKALPAILERAPNVRYLILGKGDDESHLRAMVTERGLDRIVTFAGTTRDLPPYYSAADLFVMLPDNEANSVASHEALASGLPVVASNTGGFPEVMRPEFSHLLDPDDSVAFAEAVVMLGADATLRSRMGKAARAYAEEHLSWKSSAAKLSAFIDKDSVQ